MRAQHEVFFGESVDGDINSADWRVALAQRLREHLTFVNLLRVLEGRPKALSEIVERLRPSLPVASDGEAVGVLNGLCALISVRKPPPQLDSFAAGRDSARQSVRCGGACARIWLESVRLHSVRSSFECPRAR